MKTNDFFLLVVFFLLVISSACSSNTIEGSGNIISEARQVSGFDRVTLSGFGDVTIEQGDEESLTVSADDNIMPYVRTEVKNNTLILDFDDKGQNIRFNPTDGIKFSLMIKNLSRIDISGAGSVEVNELETERLLADLSGAGSLEIGSLTADELVVRHSGAGTVYVSGQVEGQEVIHSGIGSYDAADLMSQTAIIKVSGAGGATVWAVETLDVEISGPGNVIYYGSPRIIQDVSGGGKLISTIFTDEHDVPMALVRSGPFEMGSNGGADDEQPVHIVMLDDFYIDLYEVTNSQYAICADLEICDPTTDTTAFESSYSRGIYFGNPEYADYPVIYANWHEAQKFCEWRGGRLPTEAEWEKAARGGLEGKIYPWGDEAPVCEDGTKNGAKFDDDEACNNTDTVQVGSYSPNGHGLYDMAGNVWEWVSDFYDENYYASSPANDPSGPEDGGFPVVRGGSWDNSADRLRVSDRRFNEINGYGLSIGFRCVRTDTSPLPLPTKIPEGSKDVLSPPNTPEGGRAKK